MEELEDFEKKIQTLSDQELVAQTGSFFKREKRMGDIILLSLREIKARRIYSKLGYSSLFEMLIGYYHLSEGPSYQRLNALKLIETVPEAQELIFKGEVSLSNAALVQGLIQRTEKEAPLSLTEKQELLESVKGKTTKQAKASLTAQHPVASLPLNQEKPLSATHTQILLTLDQETLKLFKEAKDLLSHSIPNGDLSEVLKSISIIAVEHLAKKKGRTPPLKSPTSVKQSVDDSPIPSRYISQEIKRIVFARAGGCCEFVGSEGHRCTSRFQLEIDHLYPWSQGGSNRAENLSLKCKSHNFYRTKETHGFFYNVKK
ncbi:MAG TPA: HNH endonuclease signature motif containing protein [Pseudobdellovibrionaceae bacterium]|jgi:hypothetical protein